ncbi:hypothetical protein EH221_06645 [bacterium]|nr:MAG: hypothetical protein EH221_06645 [bacterium]
MNFDPFISSEVAIIMTLTAAFMWGSWFICLKYLDDYPIEGFYIILFSTSMIIVWGLGFLLDGSSLIQNLRDVWHANPSKVYVTFVCGFLYVSGMQFSLRVMRMIGLAISQPLSASISIIIGTLVSGIIGGIPEGMTILRIMLAAAFLLAAVYLTMKAGRIRNRDQAAANIDSGLPTDPAAIRQAIILLLISAIFIPAYSTGLSYGLKSITQPDGLAVMPFMTMLCSGAFTGALIICGTGLTIKKKWDAVIHAGFSKYKLGIISGFAHYGGNIIHTFATRHLSSVVSWPLGFTAGLWTQSWGLIYGEFKGASKKAYILLFSGFVSYLIGALIISNIF